MGKNESTGVEELSSNGGLVWDGGGETAMERGEGNERKGKSALNQGRTWT